MIKIRAPEKLKAAGLWWIAATLILVCGRPAHAILHVDFFNFQPSENGEDYRIAVIRNSRAYDPAYDPDGLRGEKAARAIAERSHAWVQDLFAKEYPDFSAADFGELNGGVAIDDPRLTRIVAMRADDPKRIVGSLVLIYDDLRGQLPYDSALGKYQRPKRTFREFIEYDMMTWGLSKSLQYTGGVVQLMEFVVDPSVRGELNAVLHFASEYDLTAYRIPDLAKVRVPHRNLPAGTSRQDFFGQHTPVKNFTSDFWLLPEDYILFCAGRMVEYYQRLGFEIVKRRGKLFGMRIARKDFVKISSESPFFRRAYNKLDSMGLNMDTYGDGRPEGRGLLYPPGDDPDRHGENYRQRFQRIGREMRKKRSCEYLLGPPQE